MKPLQTEESFARFAAMRTQSVSIKLPVSEGKIRCVEPRRLSIDALVDGLFPLGLPGERAARPT